MSADSIELWLGVNVSDYKVINESFSTISKHLESLLEHIMRLKTSFISEPK